MRLLSLFGKLDIAVFDDQITTSTAINAPMSDPPKILNAFNQKLLPALLPADTDVRLPEIMAAATGPLGVINPQNHSAKTNTGGCAVNSTTYVF